MVHGLVKRIGGKYFNYKHFIDLFPDSLIYCELFVGGGSVFFNKKKKYQTNVINDNDERLIQTYRHVQEYGSSINVDGTYTLEQFKNFIDSTDPEDYIRQQRLSFRHPTMFNTTQSSIKNTNKHYTILQKQLEHVIIRNDDWHNILVEYDGEDTFFYLDPPYENSNRTVKRNSVGSTRLQTYTDIDLSSLINVLRTIKGKFLMTLNDSERIRELCRDFTILTYTARYARSNKTATELIIKNF